MPHRYWRVSFWMGDVTGGTNATIALSEVEMRGSIGGADLTGSGTPSAVPASGNTGSGVIANVFDNNTGTSFVIGHLYNLHPEYQHIVYDFGSPVDVAEISLRSGSGHTSERAIVGYSDDNLTWTWMTPNFDVTALRVAATTVVISGFGALTSGTFRREGVRERINTGWPPLGARPHRTSEPYIKYVNVVDAGRFMVTGTVAIDDSPSDIPAQRRVRLFEKVTGRMLRETWSDPDTGAYSFENLPDRLFFVLAHDHTGEYDIVAHDSIAPEAMT